MINNINNIRVVDSIENYNKNKKQYIISMAYSEESFFNSETMLVSELNEYKALEYAKQTTGRNWKLIRENKLTKESRN